MSLSRLHKLFFLGLISAAGVASAFLLCLYLSEQFFFDKFYYRKSPVFGYSEELSNPLAQTNNPPTLERRLQDLRFIFSSETVAHDPDRVLGASSDTPYTVLFIGDSYVYGNGVRDDERMSVFLEKKLNTVRPTKVFTLAQSGDSIMDNYYKLHAAEKVVKPDLIIMGMVVNDFIFDQYDKYPGEADFYQELRTDCPQEERTLTWLGPQMSTEEGMEYNLYPSVDPKYANVCYYESILRRMAGKQVLFYSFEALTPDAPDPSQKYYWQGWHVMHEYARRARNHGFEVVSTNNIDNFVYTPVANQEGHPSEGTHRLYAKSLFTEISSNPKWKFSP